LRENGGKVPIFQAFAGKSQAAQREGTAGLSRPRHLSGGERSTAREKNLWEDKTSQRYCAFIYAETFRQTPLAQG
jgi:hypothetical protein